MEIKRIDTLIINEMASIDKSTIPGLNNQDVKIDVTIISGPERKTNRLLSISDMSGTHLGYLEILISDLECLVEGKDTSGIATIYTNGA